MSNLNLDLIEKVRKGEAQVYNDINKPELMIELFTEIKGEATVINGERPYYRYDTNLKVVFGYNVPKPNMDTIALSAFFTNQLTPEDNKTIELIDERLKQLNIDENSSVMLEFLCRPDISQKIVKMLDGEKQPSPAKDEVEYAYVFNVQGFTKDKIYPVQFKYGKFLDTYFATNDIGSEVALIANQLKATTKAEYQAQQQVEWKVGEWCKTSLGKIFFIEEVGKGILGSTQENENDTILVTQEAIKFCTKPTEQEVFEHLRGIAEKKYPVGSKVKFGEFIKKVTSPLCFKYIKGKLECADFEYWTPTKGWAEQVEDVKERWKPEIREKYYYIFADMTVQHEKWDGMNEDIKMYETGNCFKTEAEAQFYAQKIKQLLTNI